MAFFSTRTSRGQFFHRRGKKVDPVSGMSEQRKNFINFPRSPRGFFASAVRQIDRALEIIVILHSRAWVDTIGQSLYRRTREIDERSTWVNEKNTQSRGKYRVSRACYSYFKSDFPFLGIHLDAESKRKVSTFSLVREKSAILDSKWGCIFTLIRMLERRLKN